MILNKNNKSQLEWFINPQLAGNSPQASASQSLLNVLISFSKLSDSIFTVAKALPDNESGVWTSISRRSFAMEAKLKSDFGMKDAFELTALLNEICDVSANLKVSPQNFHQGLFSNFRQVLANLILYAKEFGDIGFKSEVLKLVKRWEAIK